MKEILNQNGFTYLGLCRICKNQFEDYTKNVNGKVVVVKTRIDQRKAKIIIGGETFWIQAGAGSSTPMRDRLEFVLKEKGII